MPENATSAPTYSSTPIRSSTASRSCTSAPTMVCCTASAAALQLDSGISARLRRLQSSFTNNDGLEVLAYMPGSTISGTAADLIHPNATIAANVAVDYCDPPYGHNYFVNATPGTGDLFYGGAVAHLGGRRPGRRWRGHLRPRCHQAGQFLRRPTPQAWSWASGTAAPSAAWVTPPAAPTAATLGNTFGTPRSAACTMGAGRCSLVTVSAASSGDAGIFVMTVDPNTGRPERPSTT